jgi:hypothetical protein
MPYTIPTADDFFTRFPIFEDKDEDMVTAILAEAASAIDESWRETDYQPAILYLAAHLIATDNTDAATDVEFGPPGVVSSESFAGMSVGYGKVPAASAANASVYGATEYGRRYYSLLVKNKPGVTVA